VLGLNCPNDDVTDMGVADHGHGLRGGRRTVGPASTARTSSAQRVDVNSHPRLSPGSR